MSAITQRDYEAMLSGIGRLFDCECLEQFPHVTLAETLRLIGAESGTFTYVAPSVPRVAAVAIPEMPRQAERDRTFAQYLPDHPVLKHYLATGNGQARKISDFQSVREYHALPLYQEFYRDLQYEDQIAVVLFPPGSELIAVALARDRRSFTERDRQVLDLLRPQFARAYRHVEKADLLKRGLQQREPLSSNIRVAPILLDAEDRPVQFGAEAQRWIDYFFPERSRNPSRLPEAVAGWLRLTRKGQRFGREADHRREALVRERDGQRLRLSVFPGSFNSARMLVLGLETIPNASRGPAPGKLTRREINVLLEVEQGKTNEEVAAALGISPLTVRCHLEHIFEKLHVPNRTAATTQFRRLYASVVSMIGAMMIDGVGFGTEALSII